MPTVWGGGGRERWIKNRGIEVNLKAHPEFQGILQELTEKGFHG